MRIFNIDSDYTRERLPDLFRNCFFYSVNSKLNGYNYSSTYSVKYIIKGFETYEVNGREMSVKEGEYLLVNSDSQVRTIDAFGEAVSIFISTETLNDVSKILNSKSIEKPLETPMECSNDFMFKEGIYKHENHNMNEWIDGLSTMINSLNTSKNLNLSQSFFFNLAETLIVDQIEHSNRMNLLTSQSKATMQEQYRRLLKGCDYMKANLNKPFSLKEVANTSCLSPYHFHRLFSESLGRSPYNYFLDIQMTEAIKLLQSSSISIQEISTLLGYNSSSAFGRAFKKFTGSAPTFFRTVKL